MAAAAFKASMVAALGSPSGAKKIFPLTVSDVNGEFAIYPSGGSEIVLNGDSDVYITDLILSAAGTDTTQLEFYVGGLTNGVKILNATTLATTVIRPLQLAPIFIPRGQSFKIKQLT